MFGLPVSRGVAIGRAVLVASSRVDVAHYFIEEAQVESEIARLRASRDAVAAELSTLQRDLPADAPGELSALLDVHLMLLHDDSLTGATTSSVLSTARPVTRWLTKYRRAVFNRPRVVLTRTGERNALSSAGGGVWNGFVLILIRPRRCSAAR